MYTARGNELFKLGGSIGQPRLTELTGTLQPGSSTHCNMDYLLNGLMPIETFSTKE
jgi:hypothetical protein